jgi:hypothetical protein
MTRPASLSLSCPPDGRLRLRARRRALHARPCADDQPRRAARPHRPCACARPVRHVRAMPRRTATHAPTRRRWDAFIASLPKLTDADLPAEHGASAPAYTRCTADTRARHRRGVSDLPHRAPRAARGGGDGVRDGLARARRGRARRHAPRAELRARLLPQGVRALLSSVVEREG